MNRRPMTLASLILFGTALLVLTLAASIRPQPVGAQPTHAESQTTRQAPLNSASAVWSNIPITDTGLNGTQLHAVTVDSAGTIWAVGNRSSADLVIISSTNAGTSWFTFTQNLGVSSELLGIAAVSPTSIFAVGDYVPSSGTPAKTLVMHYNGSSWSLVSSVDFTGYDTRLLAVAATAGGDVWAAGRKVVSGGSSIYTVVERWDSATSSFVNVNTSSLNFVPGNLLNGVALTGASNVWVVGESNSYALIGHWNGTSWAVTTYSPPGASIYSFAAIALDPDANARVVGHQQVSGVNQPLMARYSFSGTTISRDGVFTDTRVSGSASLYGVAVTTTNDLWAVGTYTLTEHYDGLSWEIVPAEQVGSIQQSLYGVAVDPVRDGAWAVGYYTNGGAFQPLVERYARPVTPQPPKYTVSYYIRDLSILATQGCSASKGITSGIIVLDFGKPAAQGVSSGTILFDANNTFASTSQIRSAVGTFANSYYNCPPPVGQPQPITIAIGTNNLVITSSDVMSNASKAADHGRAWGLLVNQVYEDLKAKGYIDLISVSGASDMEIDWNYPTETIAWATGYNSTAYGTRYYNVGDCAGCPFNMSHNWTYTNVYSISWGIRAALPLPEIYTTDGGWAREWQQVSVLTRDFTPYQRMLFAGSMTQKGACLTNPCLPITQNPPDAGWRQLWEVLNFDPLGRTAQDLQSSTDITYNR